MKELGEFGLIGAGIGGGFLNTSELHVMKFDEAMIKQFFLRELKESKIINTNWIPGEEMRNESTTLKG
jgi:hypothetical protein